jgi:heme exporter protein A
MQFELLGFSKSYTDRVICYPDISVGGGDFIVISGVSGSGKTTLCDMIVGFVPIDSGGIRINGFKPKNIWEHIHYLSQMPDHNLIGITPADDLKLYNSDRNQLPFAPHTCKYNDSTLSTLDYFGLSDVLDTPVWKLSFGQKKALSFCGLLTCHRDIWLLDEPLSGLDKVMIEKFLEICKKHVNSGGIVIATSHVTNMSYLTTNHYPLIANH